MRNQRGFTLIEVLVALAIVTGILLAGLGFFWQQRAATRRLRAHRAAESALETGYELVRSGAVPLIAGTLREASGSEPAVILDVAPGERPGTVAIDLVALYEVDERPYRRTLRALLSAP